MRFLCRLGWHRWEYRTTSKQKVLARCRRDGCPVFARWATVHEDAKA